MHTSIQANKNYQGSLQPRGFPSLPEDWISEWETFWSADGKLQLFGVLHHARDWKGHRALVISHGLGEHGGRYLHFPHYLGNAVDAVYCYDHRGHGRSEGIQGHVDRFTQFSEDLALVIRRLDDQLRKRFGRSEIHLMGHSLGSLIMLKTLFSNADLPLASVTGSSLFLGIRMEVPAAKRMVAHALSRLWSSLQMTSDLDARLLSRDPEVVVTYDTDRLVHRKATPRFYTELVSTLEEMSRHHSGLAYPILALIPEADQITNPEKAKTWFEALQHPEKQIRLFPGGFHEGFNDIEKDKLFGELREWIAKHSGGH